MQSRTIRPILAILALALPPLPGSAEPEEESSEAVTERLESAPTLHGKLALSLAEAIKMGLENNLEVEVERHLPLIAEEEVGVSWGAYDPTLFSEVSYVDTKTPNANLVLGQPLSKNKSRPEGFGGLAGLVPLLGSEYEFQFSGSKQTTNNTFAALSPEYASSFSLRFTQPLLKDLIWSEPWTRVKTSRIVADGSRQQFHREVMNVVERIEKAYWDLIAKDDQVRVAEKSLETAEALLEQTQTQYDVGVVSKVEVVESEAGVAERDFSRIRARNAYRNAQDRLIDLVLGAGLRAESTLEILATDRPEEYIEYQIDVPAAVSKAFQYRPELAAARKQIEREEIQVKFAKNQRMPELDFRLSWGQSGLAGSENSDFDCFIEPCPEIGNTNFGDTFDVWSDTDSLTVGAVFSIPIPNRSARHTVSKTELELRRAKTRKRRLEQTIVLDVREKARNLEASQEGIEAAERRRLAAEEQLRAERIRLEYGESTPFDVLLRERDLVEAETQKIAALQVYRTSATDLDRAQGTILRNRNIRIDDVSALRLQVR